MRVDITRNIVTRSSSIYVTEDVTEDVGGGVAGGQRMILRPGAPGAPWDWQMISAEQVDIEPSLVLTDEVLKMIVEQAYDLTPPDRGMADALQDTRATRDRLLALVEKVVNDG